MHYCMVKPHSSNFRVITAKCLSVQTFWILLYVLKAGIWYTCKAIITWATSWENLFMPYTNNNGADQPAHQRSLVSSFVVRYLDSIIFLVSISEISSLWVASMAAQVGLRLAWSKTSKTGFLVTRLIFHFLQRVDNMLASICICNNVIKWN